MTYRFGSASGVDCCGFAECRCDAPAADWSPAERAEHRTNRLLRAIDAAEARVEFLWAECEKHPALPEAMERLNNLTRALLNHRRTHCTEIF